MSVTNLYTTTIDGDVTTIVKILGYCSLINVESLQNNEIGVPFYPIKTTILAELDDLKLEVCKVMDSGLLLEHVFGYKYYFYQFATELIIKLGKYLNVVITENPTIIHCLSFDGFIESYDQDTRKIYSFRHHLNIRITHIYNHGNKEIRYVTDTNWTGFLDNNLRSIDRAIHKTYDFDSVIVKPNKNEIAIPRYENSWIFRKYFDSTILDFDRDIVLIVDGEVWIINRRFSFLRFYRLVIEDRFIVAEKMDYPVLNRTPDSIIKMTHYGHQDLDFNFLFDLDLRYTTPFHRSDDKTKQIDQKVTEIIKLYPSIRMFVSTNLMDGILFEVISYLIPDLTLKQGFNLISTIKGKEVYPNKTSFELHFYNLFS